MRDHGAGAEDDEAGLALLAQSDLRLALGFAQRAEAEQDPEIANGLARTYQRLARSCRQTLAIKARLRRDRIRDAREDRDDLRREHARRVTNRLAHVRAMVKGLIWTEAEGEEAERLEDELLERLEEQAEAPDFADTPADAHVARLCADLGLSPPAAADAPAEPHAQGPFPIPTDADRDGPDAEPYPYRSSA